MWVASVCARLVCRGLLGLGVGQLVPTLVGQGRACLGLLGVRNLGAGSRGIQLVLALAGQGRALRRLLRVRGLLCRHWIEGSELLVCEDWRRGEDDSSGGSCAGNRKAVLQNQRGERPRRVHPQGQSWQQHTI